MSPNGGSASMRQTADPGVGDAIGGVKASVEQAPRESRRYGEPDGRRGVPGCQAGESARIDDSLLVDVIKAHALWWSDDLCVVGLKPHVFRRKFDAIIAELGLESLGLTPAGLRAGGATERNLQNKPIADTCCCVT